MDSTPAGLRPLLLLPVPIPGMGDVSRMVCGVLFGEYNVTHTIEGLMWTEDLAASIGSSTIVKNYAVAGATVDHTLWPSRVRAGSSQPQ